MKNTCLYPFYEYLFKGWIQSGQELSEYEKILVILKAFSSSMPILLNYAEGTDNYSGGGFYILWNGCGIAVDYSGSVVKTKI